MVEAAFILVEIWEVNAYNRIKNSRWARDGEYD